MSGGFFDHRERVVLEFASKINDYIFSHKHNDNTDNPEITKKMKKTIKELIAMEKKLHRIDWYISGDDGEETFLRLWKEEGLK